jgi:uncharacterized membrane protein YccF (DUF307 family)
MTDEQTPDYEPPMPTPIVESAAPMAVAPAAAMETAATNVNVIVTGKAQHGFLLRALWYIVFGWWVSSIVSALAYLCIVSVIGIPAGFWLINRIPATMTLRQRTRDIVGTIDEAGNVVLVERHIPQASLLLRGLWFVVVGWWALGIWMGVAWFASVSIIGIPLGILMYNRAPWVATLQRN